MDEPELPNAIMAFTLLSYVINSIILIVLIFSIPVGEMVLGLMVVCYTIFSVLMFLNKSEIVKTHEYVFKRTFESVNADTTKEYNRTQRAWTFIVVTFGVFLISSTTWVYGSIAFIGLLCNILSRIYITTEVKQKLNLLKD